jgi:hypothetical protein
VAFAPQPYLYKLYVNREFREGDDPAADTATRAFLQSFLPRLDEALFPGDVATDVAATGVPSTSTAP